MIINCDAKALEWVCGTFLSKDKVAYEEIIANVDQHNLNQTAFGLPSRLIAKKFVFRLMYGGSAYSYANDPDFMEVSRKEQFWQDVIDAFYHKYGGFALWHNNILKEAMTTGQLVMPTGRIYEFEMKPDFRGNMKVPETIIKNYPVQGLGADIMCIARVYFAGRFFEENIDGLLVNTIHDSIVVDCAAECKDRVTKLFYETFELLPMLFEKVFQVKWDLPLRCEISVGNNMSDLTEVA